MLNDHVVVKGTDVNIECYSAFGSHQRNVQTRLFSLLKELKTPDVYIAGLATDTCVKLTAMDSIRLGFRTTGVVDACRGFDRESTKKSLGEIIQARGHVVLSRDLDSTLYTADTPPYIKSEKINDTFFGRIACPNVRGLSACV